MVSFKEQTDKLQRLGQSVYVYSWAMGSPLLTHSSVMYKIHRILATRGQQGEVVSQMIENT